jgi:AcrR family transcriptional regulator
MPKRDESYMNRQREILAAAALACLHQKGLAETTMRDVAKMANVSLGTLYVHFSNKDELVTGACNYSRVRFWAAKPCKTWSEYILAADHTIKGLRSDLGRRSARVSLQMAAELAVNKNDQRLYSEAHREGLNVIRDQLRILHQNGEISLPLGLEQTALAHAQLGSGLAYSILWVHEADLHALIRSYKAALDLTAGYQRVARVRKSV